MHAPPSSSVRMLNENDAQCWQGERERQGRVEHSRPVTQVYLEAGGNVLPNRSTFPLRTGTRTGRWEVVGLGLGRMVVAMYPAPAPGLTRRSCSSNPLLPRNQHPSPTTSFTNVKQPKYFN